MGLLGFCSKGSSGSPSDGGWDEEIDAVESAIQLNGLVTCNRVV